MILSAIAFNHFSIIATAILGGMLIIGVTVILIKYLSKNKWKK